MNRTFSTLTFSQITQCNPINVKVINMKSFKSKWIFSEPRKVCTTIVAVCHNNYNWKLLEYGYESWHLYNANKFMLKC